MKLPHQDRGMGASSVAIALGVHRTTAWRWMTDGTLETFRLPNGSVRVRESWLDEYIEGRCNASEEASK